MSLLASYLADLSYYLTTCLSCFPSSPNLKINNRTFKIRRLLGEGGFSYVYLVSPTSSSPSDFGTLYALKKIRCPFGQESVAQALKEVEAYSLFSPHPNIIQAIDHSVVTDRGDPSAKTVYILLPYYRRGNLQDIINANLVNRTRFPERRLMILLLGVCRALKALHQYRVKSTGDVCAAKRVRHEAVKADAEAEEAAEELRMEDGDTGGQQLRANSSRRRRKEEMRFEHQQGGDAENEPLMEDEVTRSQEGVKEGEIRAYAHRDIKPGNIMLASSSTPILMDFGSLTPSPTHITSRSAAIAEQDLAAEHSTLPYRAPELFDVKSDSMIDTKVDIWSLGCTVYACLVGKSPFEARSEETGGSLTMCVLGGDWRFPDETGTGGGGGTAVGASGRAGGGYKGGPNSNPRNQTAETGKDDHGISPQVRDLIRSCLSVEPGQRPDVDELIVMVQDIIAQLPAEPGDEEVGVGEEEDQM